MVCNNQNYAHGRHFFNTNKQTSVCWGGFWSKSSISQKIVPRNRISKSLEGKQFINVCWWLNIVSATIAWCKLMELGIPLALVCHFLAERFHTLKIESDFFSRQGHWTLSRTAVYHGLLLLKIQRRSSLYFCTKAIKLTWNSITTSDQGTWLNFRRTEKFLKNLLSDIKISYSCLLIKISWFIV